MDCKILSFSQKILYFLSILWEEKNLFVGWMVTLEDEPRYLVFIRKLCEYICFNSPLLFYSVLYNNIGITQTLFYFNFYLWTFFLHTVKKSLQISLYFLGGKSVKKRHTSVVCALKTHRRFFNIFADFLSINIAIN